MKFNKTTFILRLIAIVVLFAGAILTDDLVLSQLFTGLAIFTVTSIFRYNLDQNKKLENYEEAK